MPVFVAEGQEVLGSGGKPTEESVHYDQVLDVVALNKGVLNSAAARKLDNMGFTLEESQAPGEEEEWERFPLEKDFADEEADPQLAAGSWLQVAPSTYAAGKPWSPVHSFSVQRRTWAYVYGQVSNLLEKIIWSSRAVLVVKGAEEDSARPAGSRAVVFESHSAVQKYLTLGFVEFLEIFCGYGQLTMRVGKA